MNIVRDKIMDIWNKLISFRWTNAIHRFFSKGNRRFVLFLYLIAFGVFAYTLFTNWMVIPMSGDFKLQEIPFYYNGYDDWWTSLTSGQFVMWDESGFLGVNNIGANTFYYLLNIFFLPVLLVPRYLVPQALAFMMITKFVLAGYVMKRLLNYMGVSEQSSKIVSIAYAFSGWSLFYVWFNHFLEIAVLFPLVLYGIEKLLREKRCFLLIGALFFSALTNYFFFIMFCFCSVIYAVFRYFQKWKEYTGKERGAVIGLGILSYVVALLMALMILLPAFHVVLQSSRTAVSDSSFTGKLLAQLQAIKTAFGEKDWKSIWAAFKEIFNISVKYDGSYTEKFYLYPVVSYFFPPYACYDSTLFNNTYYDNMNCSLFMYNPLMLMLVPSLITSIKEKKISHIIAFLGILGLIFTPFAYYCFSGFTSVCYGRWQLFVTTAGCIYTAFNFDKLKSMKRWYFCVGEAITLGMQLLCIFMALKMQGTDGSGTSNLDERKYYAYIEVIYCACMFVYFMIRLRDPNFKLKLNFIIAVEAILAGNVLVQGQGTVTYTSLYGGYSDSQDEIKLVQRLNEKDEDYFRVFSTSADRDGNNVGMVLGARGLGTFHSIYNYKMQDFIDWTHLSYTYHGWSMGIHEKRANLNTFLNIKYCLLDESDTNIPFGYEKIDQENTTVVYEDTNYVGFGFAFDNIISAEKNAGRENGYTSTASYESTASYQARVVKNENLFVRYGIVYDEDGQEIAAAHPAITYTENLDTDTKRTDDDVFSDQLTVVRFSCADVQISKAIWDQSSQGAFDGMEDPVSYTRTDAKHLLWNSEVNVDCSSYGVAKEAKERGGAFVTVKARMGENLIIYLYGTDENGNEYLLTSDRHMKHNYNKSYDWKYERGFYVNDQVTRIQIVVKDTFGAERVLEKPDVTYEYYDTYKANIDKLKESPIENLKIKTNAYTFDTNYASEKFVVLTIPYDDGWSLKDSKGSNIKLYKADGGFLGFVSESGEASYRLSYATPELQKGCLGLALGMSMFGCLYVALDLNYCDKRDLKKQLGLF